jgi:transposase
MYSAQQFPVGIRAWSIAGLETIRRYRTPLSEYEVLTLWQGELDIELSALDRLWEELNAIDLQLTNIAKQDARVQLLELISGVGRRTAEFFGGVGKIRLPMMNRSISLH